MLLNSKKDKDKKIGKITSDPSLLPNSKKKASIKNQAIKTPEFGTARKITSKEQNLKQKHRK